MKKKIILTASLAMLLLAGGGYYFLRSQPEVQLEKALQAFSERDFQSTEQILNALATQNASLPLSIYKGFISQMGSRFQEAESFFQRALKEPHKCENHLMEILLGQAINAYFEQKDDLFCSLVERARSVNPHYPLLTFFEGLASYTVENYEEALKLWENSSQFVSATPPDLAALSGKSGWLEIVVQQLFSYTWFELHLSHAQIETGDFLQARRTLERIISTVPQKDSSLAFLLFGISYLKEAHSIPLENRTSYHHLASFYINQGKECKRERKAASRYLEKETAVLIHAAQLDDTIEFITFLEEWDEKSALNTLADCFIQGVLKDNKISSCRWVREKFAGTFFHHLIAEKFFQNAAQKIREGNMGDLSSQWTLVEALAPAPDVSSEQLSALLFEEILMTAKVETGSLNKTKKYLVFWQKLNPRYEQREKLSPHLLSYAKLFWLKEGFEKKGEQLMTLALSSSCHRETTFQEIATFLTDLYCQAENSNLLQRMVAIYEAMELFQINTKTLVSAAKLANHLADAEYLFRVHNYVATQSSTSWVLKQDPHNQLALRLKGLSSFHLGNFEEAFACLNRLVEPDAHTHQVLVLSQVLAVQEGDSQLARQELVDEEE